MVGAADAGKGDRERVSFMPRFWPINARGLGDRCQSIRQLLGDASSQEAPLPLQLTAERLAAQQRQEVRPKLPRMGGAADDDRIGENQAGGSECGHGWPFQATKHIKPPVPVADEELSDQQVGYEEPMAPSVISPQPRRPASRPVCCCRRATPCDPSPTGAQVLDVVVVHRQTPVLQVRRQPAINRSPAPTSGIAWRSDPP